MERTSEGRRGGARNKAMMSKTSGICRIFKYVLSDKSESDVQMRVGADILDVQSQDGMICVWALSNDTDKKESRKFRMFGTGLPISKSLMKGCEYIGTVQHGIHVAHVFEEIVPFDIDEALNEAG